MTFLSEYIDCYKGNQNTVTYIVDTTDIVTVNAIILLNNKYDKIVITPKSDCPNRQLLSQYCNKEAEAFNNTALSIWGYYEARNNEEVA